MPFSYDLTIVILAAPFAQLYPGRFPATLKVRPLSLPTDLKLRIWGQGFTNP
jgi:hypothetical protein